MKTIVVLTEKEKKISTAMISNLKKMGWNIDDVKEAAHQLIEAAEKNNFTGEDTTDFGYFTGPQDDMDFYERWNEELEEKFNWENGSSEANTMQAGFELMAAHYMALTVLKK